MNTFCKQEIKPATNDPSAVLETYELAIGYKTKGKAISVAVHLNLQLQPGKFVCLLGANGAGKSTLIRTLAGVQPPLEGKVHIQQKNIAEINKTDLAKKLSLVLTDLINTGNLNVYTILTLGRYPYSGWFGLLNRTDKEIIREAVRATGIERFLNKYIHELSDGERQKVMIARALVQDTPLIVLDEPTAHLDLPNRVEVMRLLRSMVRKTKKTVLLSTHELDLALQAADEIWLMMPNQSLITGVPEDLIIDGRFENAFRKNGFDFCRETGTFKVNIPDNHKKVWLLGGKVNYFWTKRALEREGYSLSADAATVILILESEQKNCWTITTSSTSQICYTIGEMLHYLILLSHADDPIPKGK
jgi:iron complex transport system ATP-binding protein